jgi:hypothetical protein
VDYDFDKRKHEWLMRSSEKGDGGQRIETIKFKNKGTNKLGFKKIRLPKDTVVAYLETGKPQGGFFIEFKKVRSTVDAERGFSTQPGVWWEWIDKRIFDDEWEDEDYDMGVNNLIKDKDLINKIKTEYKDEINELKCSGLEDYIDSDDEFY